MGYVSLLYLLTYWNQTASVKAAVWWWIKEGGGQPVGVSALSFLQFSYAVGLVTYGPQNPVPLIPHVYLPPSLEVTSLEFAEIFGIKKLEPWALILCCLHDPTLSHFGAVPACDR